MKKKIPKLQILRFVVQVIFIIFFSGLFSLTFGELKQVFQAIKDGSFNLMQMFPNLIEAFAIIPLTLLFGRFFCGWFCAFGAFNDFIYLISSKIFRTKFRISKGTDRILKKLKYIILIFIIIFMWTLGNKSLDKFNPWDAFAQLPDLSAFARYAAGFIVLALIAIGAVFIERFFCRYLCPLGAVFSIISMIRIFKIDKPTDKCGNCRLCTNSCSMGIQLYKTKRVRSGECINCLKCIETCPRRNPKMSILGERINSGFASAVAITTFAGMYSLTNVVGSFISQKNALEASMNSTSVALGSSDPSNNALTGSSSQNAASAPAKSSTVKTTAKSVKSSTAKTATKSVKSSITKASRTLVKTSSTKTTTAPVKSSSTSTTTTAPKTSSTQQSGYKDGTYTGYGYGHRPGLEASVTIKNGRISYIEILADNETPRFSQVAFYTVSQEIVQTQSANVDAVSGATESSDGLMMAVQDALSKAKA